MEAIVWVTSLTQASVDLLVSGLMKRGYQVGPASPDHSLACPGKYAHLVALKLDVPASTGADDLVNSITQIFYEHQRVFLSIVVYKAPGWFSWAGGNTSGEPKSEPSSGSPTRFDILDENTRESGDSGV